MKIQIKTLAGSLLFEGDFSGLKEALIAAVKQDAYLQGADLKGADLRDADLQGAYLQGADLKGADLRDADLQDADLQGAYLRDADLQGAYLQGAYLRDADLKGADLRDADLRDADLRDADLQGAKVNWQSHALISEILRRAAGEDVEKRKVAGLVAISTDWCWERLLAIKDPLTPWALKELKKCVTKDDGAPDILK